MSEDHVIDLFRLKMGSLNKKLKTYNIVRYFGVHLCMARSKTIIEKAKEASVKKEAKRAYYAAEISYKKAHIHAYPERVEAIAAVASGAHKKAKRISLRVSETHKKTIAEASELAGFKSVNDYIIYVSLADSQKVVREHKLLTLSGQDSIAFLDALHHSQEINETLQRAMDEFVAEQGR